MMSNERAHTHQDGHPSRRFGTLWHHADFLKLWAGETVSLVGSQVTTLALPLTAVILFKATSVQLGFLYAAGFAPFLFFTLFAGVWVDHHRRRPILLVTNIGRGVLLGLIPVLAVLGWLRIEYLYGITLVVGCLTVIFYLAFQAFLPILLQRDQLVEGNSKLSASQSIAEIGGPGLAGLLVQSVSAPIAIVVDALSFFVAAASLVLMRTPESRPASATNVHRLLHEIGEGFRVTFSNRYLRAFAGEAATYNLFWLVILTVFIPYAVRQLHYSSGILGLLFAVGSAGALCGALLTGSIARRIGVGLTIVGTAAMMTFPSSCSHSLPAQHWWLWSCCCARFSCKALGSPAAMSTWIAFARRSFQITCRDGPMPAIAYSSPVLLPWELSWVVFGARGSDCN